VADRVTDATAMVIVGLGILLGVVGGGYGNKQHLQRFAKSTVPTVGYGVSYAVGNVLLALWGTVIVLFLCS
jgi:putative transport protein